jgi:phage protein D
MSPLIRPAYRVLVGSRVVDTTDEPRASTLVALDVRLHLDVPVDSATLVLGRADGLRPARDDRLEIDLGYADDGSLQRVLTGAVTTVEEGLTATRVIGHGAGEPLLRTFVDRTFRDVTSGALVRELADAAGVDVDRADDGIRYPAYVVDGRRPVAHHLRDLASLSGFDVYVNPEGELVFARFEGGRTVHVLERAQHLLEADGLHAPPRAGLVEAWGAGGGGKRGGEAWAWLTKDFGPSKGTAGTGAPTLVLERPALRTATGALAAARAASTALGRRTLRARVVVLGRPEIRLGDAVRLRGLPDESLNAVFQVRGVTHRLGKRTGFTTAIELRSIGSAGGAA